jgi:L-histidine N-alpha-methyltransferase
VTRLDRHLAPDTMRRALEDDVRAGLTATPKTLPPKWFYDAHGSVLFDDITRLPEYYPTRCERAVLQARSAEIASLTGADTLIELGSGTSEKTRLLLDALTEGGSLRRFVPFDVDESVLVMASEQVEKEYPGVEVHAVVGDFEHHLPLLPTGGRRLVAFLGGTIGNLLPDQRTQFLGTLARTLAPGDWLLLGTDLVKDPARLEAAYDDSAGVTADFNANVLRVLNRELGGDADLSAFQHVAAWNAEAEWIEMRLRSLRTQTLTLSEIGLRVDFADGEEMRTEVSAKFHQARVREEVGAAGFELRHWWTDESGDFGVSLSVKS